MSQAGAPAHAAPSGVRIVLTVLLPFSAGYFLSYGYRAVNAVVESDLVAELGLDASTLGVLTAAYLIAFALFQLPLGVLLDRYGPRRVQTALLLVAAAGSVLFALGEDAAALTAARALIGLGFAGGLMAGFNAVVLWFPPARHALANACVMSVGGLGILAATVPAELAVQAIGWRGLFLAAATLTVAVAALIALVVPERTEVRPTRTIRAQTAEIVRIYSDRFFWRVAPLVATTAGSHVGVQTLWAGPWLLDINGFDRGGKAEVLAVMAIAFLVGTLLAGAVADWLGRRGVDQLHVMLAGLALFAGSQVAIIAEVTSVPLLVWGVFAMTGQVGVLAYPRLAAHFGRERAGRAQTAINLLLFGVAWASQIVIGLVIDLFPQAQGGGYAPDGYQSAFLLLLTLQSLAFVWFLRPAPVSGAGRGAGPALGALMLGIVLIAGATWLALLE